jgi:hypothetical protein
MFSVDTEHRTREVENRAAYLQPATRILRKNILKGTVYSDILRENLLCSRVL